MLDAIQLRDCVITQVLNDIWLPPALFTPLLLFTCAVESEGGTYLKQINGPALGIYQMELVTHNDIWVNYISFHQSLKLQLLHKFDAPNIQDEHRLIYDLRYATAMAAIFYMRITEPLPENNDFNSLWQYYKRHYNTSDGAATAEHALPLWKQFIITIPSLQENSQRV